MQELINCPSLANSNILDLRADIQEFLKAHVRHIHIDIADGNYVPNLFFPLKVLNDIKYDYPYLKTDVHLMVKDPMSYYDRLKGVADYVSFHIDSTNFVRRNINAIKERGMNAGVVINPSQRIDIIEPYIDYLDMVVLMSVEPGYAGQQFMPDAVERVKELNDLRSKHGKHFLISVDGAISYPYVAPCVRNGANVLITGVFTVYKQEDGIVSACHRLEEEMKKGLEHQG